MGASTCERNQRQSATHRSGWRRRWRVERRRRARKPILWSPALRERVFDRPRRVLASAAFLLILQQALRRG